MLYLVFFQPGDCIVSNVLTLDLTSYPERPEHDTNSPNKPQR